MLDIEKKIRLFVSIFLKRNKSKIAVHDMDTMNTRRKSLLNGKLLITADSFGFLIFAKDDPFLLLNEARRRVTK